MIIQSLPLRESSIVPRLADPGGVPGDDVPARLSGIRLVRASESTEGFRLSESVIKTLTGGFDRIPVRFLHQEHFEFRPQFKLWLATNHKPVIRDAGDAIWRRVHLIPFNQCFEGETEDKDLRSKLTAECAGILAWAVRGCLRWRDEGLNPPDVVVSATREYRGFQGVVRAKRREADDGDYVRTEDQRARVSKSERRIRKTLHWSGFAGRALGTSMYS